MWPPHRQAVFRNHCVKPGPRPGPRPRPHPRGRAGLGGAASEASLQAELMRYLASVFDVEAQATGEDEEIKFSVSPMIDCENPYSDEPPVYRDSEEAGIPSHHWSCKRAWDSSPEFQQAVLHLERSVTAEAEDAGTCPLGRGEDAGTCPLDEDGGSCPLGRGKDEGSCPLGRGKDGSGRQGRSPLHWMWEGFSVDHYAPRRRPRASSCEEETCTPGQAGGAKGSKVTASRPLQISPQQEGGGSRRRQQQRGGRARAAESPRACHRAPIPPCASLPCAPKAAARGRMGPTGAGRGHRSPASRGETDEARRGQPPAPPLSDAVVRATSEPGATRRARAAPPPKAGAGGTERGTRGANPYRQFLGQYRKILERPLTSDLEPRAWSAGDGEESDGLGLRLRRKESEGQLRITKLVEQRHELIRKTMKEKEQKGLMEEKRLRKQRMKRKKIERQIAARMSVYEMEKSRKNQARKRLQGFRKHNREQAARYQAELKEMKEWVARAPFLFEQVTQNNARGTINRLFSKVLQKVHLDEGLVCTLSTVDCRDEVELIELEGEGETHTHDWEWACVLSRSERQGHAEWKEPPNSAGSHRVHGCGSRNQARRGPATHC